MAYVKTGKKPGAPKKDWDQKKTQVNLYIPNPEINKFSDIEAYKSWAYEQLGIKK